jgi:AbrB family looped-hinge helix DNA binding protein
MKTTLSSKGQIVLPSAVRRKLGLVPGATLDVALEAGRIVLAPARERPRLPKLGTDRSTGLPVLEAPAHGPQLTTNQVKELLADFP